MKRRVTLISGIAVLVLLIGGVVLLLNMPDVQDDDSITRPSSNIDSVTLLERPADNILSVNINNQFGTFTLLPEDYEILEFRDTPVNENAFINLSRSIGLLTARRVVESATDEDIAHYGLDNSFTVTYKDGEEFTFTIGNHAPGGGFDRYVMRENDSSVYLVSSNMLDVFLRPLHYFADHAVTENAPEEGSAVFDNFTLTSKGLPYTLTLLKNTEDMDDAFGGMFHTDYFISSPKSAPFDSSKEAAHWLTFLHGMTATSVIELVVDEEMLARYGFDEPDYTVEYVFGNDAVTLFFVRNEANDDELFVYRDGGSMIYTMTEEDLPFLSITYHSIVRTYRIMPHIEAIRRVSVEIDGESYTIDATETDGTITAVINGRHLDEEQYQQLYQTLLGIFGREPTFDEPDGEPVVRIVYSYRDTEITDDEVRLYRADDRSLYLWTNGVVDFKVLDAEYERIKAAIRG
jgi:hypothetical protein